jgi:DNA-binding transcriptional LysR family regulator
VIYPNLRHLRCFVTVADTGSFVAAAEAVHLGQPALSQAIANLEQQIGVRLIERTSRSLALTAAGEEFLSDARRVLASVEQMMSRGSDWAQARRGRLEVLAVPSVAYRLLPALVQEFHRAHPDIEVNVHDDRDAVLRQRLDRGDGDLSILSHTGDLSVGTALPFLRDRLRVLVSVDHPLAREVQVSAQQLASEKLVLLRRGAVFRSYADTALSAVSLAQAPLEVDQTSTLTGMVEAGIGVALLPAMNCPTTALKSVRSLPLRQPDVHRIIAFVQPPGREAMPAVQRFVHLSLAVLARRPTLLPEGCELLKVSDPAVRRFLATPRREAARAAR